MLFVCLELREDRKDTDRGVLCASILAVGTTNFSGFFIAIIWFSASCRLTAIYAIIMAGYLSLYKYLNTGPQWRPEGLEVDGCRGTWWINLLYLNNLIKTEKQVSAPSSTSYLTLSVKERIQNIF